MEMSMALATPEAAEETRKFIKKASGDATWDRLAEYLEKMASNKEIFVINRSFEAPIETVYEMWTNPEHLSQWLPPTGFTMRYIKSDIKVGGISFYSMTNSKSPSASGTGKLTMYGNTMYGKAHYLEMNKPHRIVYTQQFCDEHENSSRHPMAPTWPESMLTTVTLTEEGSNQTRVTITWEVHGAATPTEMDTFIKGKAGMTLGWTGSFDKLDNYLTSY
jgi:uncharacterized protein YndB with AHSA1/START domain